MSASLAYDELECLSWLSQLLDPSKFDLVVPVERKATAILRSLLDLTPDVPCEWTWTKVLSSDALRYLPRDRLRGQRILVFNEMIHHGSSTLDAIKAIEDNTPGASAQVYTAAFFVHEDLERDHVWRTEHLRPGANVESPDYTIARCVSEQSYSLRRQALISSLRASGALLLDTEHLESTFRSNLPHRRLLDALKSFGIPVEYEGDEVAGYPGVTVRAPVVVELDSLRSMLPEDAQIETEEPKKVRMIRRGATEFAFIPIWYVPIPVDSVTTPYDWPNAPSYMVPALQACPSQKLPELVFHLASLITGLELTKSVWSGLAPFVHKGIEPDTPRGSDVGSSPLGHLRALYPLVDFDELEKAFALAISAYRDRAASKRVQKAADAVNVADITSLRVVDAKMGNKGGKALFRKLIRDRRTCIASEDWFDDLDEEPAGDRFPATPWRDFWETGRQLGLNESVRSIIMDLSIDSAILKTTHTTITERGRAFIVRAFAPDSEFALESLERLAYGAEEVRLNA